MTDNSSGWTWRTHLRLNPISIYKLSVRAAHKEGCLDGVLEVEAGAHSPQVTPLRPGEVHHTGRPPLHLLILPLPGVTQPTVCCIAEATYLDGLFSVGPATWAGQTGLEVVCCCPVAYSDCKVSVCIIDVCGIPAQFLTPSKVNWADHLLTFLRLWPTRMSQNMMRPSPAVVAKKLHSRPEGLSSAYMEHQVGNMVLTYAQDMRSIKFYVTHRSK